MTDRPQDAAGTVRSYTVTPSTELAVKVLSTHVVIADDVAEPPPGPKSLSKTEQLVVDVIAAGGRLTLPDDAAHGGVNWRQRAYAAQRHGKVEYPITTDDLTVLLETRAGSLDLYADLIDRGDDVEGVTVFDKGARPQVLICLVAWTHEVREDYATGKSGRFA